MSFISKHCRPVNLKNSPLLQHRPLSILASMKSSGIDRKWLWILLCVLCANILYLIIDVGDDLREKMGLGHIVPEVLTAMGTVIVAVILFVRLRQSRTQSDILKGRIGELEIETAQWRARTAQFANGLSIAIDEQLGGWELSAAEKEVALLLLKGLTNKEIAQVRATTEQTVKQQSSSIYRKSGLASRSELSAFFLEDLLSPPPPEAPSISL